MEKKLWSNAEVVELGVESTFTDEIEICKASKHPCHKTGNGEHNDSGNHVSDVDQNGHVLSVDCTDLSHYNNENNLICCCFNQMPIS